MSSSAKVFCVNLIILFCGIILIRGDCSIGISDDSDINPSFYKYVGTHKVKINTDALRILLLHEQQKIEAYCYSSFKWPSFSKKINKLFLKCRDNYIYTSTDVNHRMNTDQYQSPNFICLHEKWNLYEANTNFLWCPLNVTSYLVARAEYRNPYSLAFNILAGICYDIYNLHFHSVYYTLGLNTAGNMQPTALKDFHIPGIQIDYIKEIFGSKSNTANFVEEGQFKNWITTLNYDYSSIIQHPKLKSSLNDQFASILEFIWWPNLRLYNWKRYIEALEQHVENDYKVYDVLAGISGSMKAPIVKSCQENYTMREVLPKTEQKIPLYVWNYLRDSSNSSNEIVIIGFNSPFYEFYSKDEIIFCPDKCQEISWLQKVKSSFRYNIMGAVFCCNVDDVRLSKQLDGFPENELMSELKPKVLNEREKAKLLNAENTDSIEIDENGLFMETEDNYNEN